MPSEAPGESCRNGVVSLTIPFSVQVLFGAEPGDEMPRGRSLQENNSTKAGAASVLSAVTAHQTTLVPSFRDCDKEKRQQ